jgi:hypothetical protein
MDAVEEAATAPAQLVEDCDAAMARAQASLYRFAYLVCGDRLVPDEQGPGADAEVDRW